MHEVSICQSIISTVESEFPEEHLAQIREIHLKIGVLSCVQPEFVEQVYKLMTADSPLQNSRLLFDRVDIVAVCVSCRQNFKVANHVFICPYCGMPSSEIIEGNELKIHKVILEEFSYEETNK